MKKKAYSSACGCGRGVSAGEESTHKTTVTKKKVLGVEKGVTKVLFSRVFYGVLFLAVLPSFEVLFCFGMIDNR